MKRITQLIKVFFIWLLMIDIISFICLNIFSKTILNQSYILSQLEEEKYYENVYYQIQNSFEGYIGPSGLEETILNGIYSKDKVKQDIINVVNYIYTGKNYEINTEEIQVNLSNNINESLLNYNLSEEEKKSIVQFEEEIINEYKKQITHSQYFDKLANYIPKIIENVLIIKIAMGVIGFLIIGILFFINKKNFVKFMITIIISVLGSGLFLLFAKFWTTSKIEISNITILSDSFSILSIVSIILLIIFNNLLYKDNINKKLSKNKKVLKKNGGK